MRNKRLDRALAHCKASKLDRENNIDKRRFIYIMKCDKYYKIGYASNMYERFTQYKVHNPLDVTMICNIKTPRFKEFEDWIFSNYSDKLHRGEWYHLNDDDLLTIKSEWFNSLASQLSDNQCI